MGTSSEREVDRSSPKATFISLAFLNSENALDANRPVGVPSFPADAVVEAAVGAVEGWL